MKRMSFLSSTIALAIFGTSALYASTTPTTKEIQKVPTQTLNTTLSPISYPVWNNGIMGLTPNNTSGVFWNRSSKNSYLFGSGFWFGAKKFFVNQTNELVEISLNPNSGESWFGPKYINNDTASTRGLVSVYRSTDFNADGTPKQSGALENYPVWKRGNAVLGTEGYLGSVISNPDERNQNMQPQGIAVLSDEDFVVGLSDYDLSLFGIGENLAKALGHPLGIDVDMRVFTFAQGVNKDAIIVRYTFTNTSNDTLRDCWIAPVFDYDIGAGESLNDKAFGDRMRYFQEDASLSLVASWTEAKGAEIGKGLGYMGYALLESPAVDNNGVLRNDKTIYKRSEQLGLKVVKDWVIANDPARPQYYSFMSTGGLESSTNTGDKRVLLSSGSFTMLPGASTSLSYALVFALPASGGECNGSAADLQNLVQATKNIASTFDSWFVTTNVEEVETAGTVVYPNPASTHITLNLPANSHHISIVSPLGATLHQQPIAGSSHIRVQTDSFTNGVYYCRIVHNNGVSTFPFVIER